MFKAYSIIGNGYCDFSIIIKTLNVNISCLRMLDGINGQLHLGQGLKPMLSSDVRAPRAIRLSATSAYGFALEAAVGAAGIAPGAE